jgi:hypothetical protein
VPLHHPEQVQGPDEVVVVVPQRLADRLPDGLEAGEVDDGVDRMFREDGVDGGLKATRRRASSLEFTRLSTTTTSCPASCRDRTVCEPM